MDTNRCEALKQNGERCTRNHKHVTPAGKYVCKQHLTTKTTISDTVNDEPWTKKGLVVPKAENGKKNLQKIRTKILHGPKKVDGGGSIYIYYLSREKKLGYWKIGKTKRSADDRLQEWADVHKEELVSHKIFVVKKNVSFIEALIHKYLTYCNIHRYPYGKGLHSVYSMSGEVLADGQQQLEGPGDKTRLVAKNKLTEWFAEDIDVIMGVVESIIKVYGQE